MQTGSPRTDRGDANQTQVPLALDTFDQDVESLKAAEAKLQQMGKLVNRIDELAYMRELSRRPRTAEETEEYESKIRDLQDMIPGVVKELPDPKTGRWKVETEVLHRHMRALEADVAAQKAKVLAGLDRRRKELDRLQKIADEAERALREATAKK